MALPIRYLHLSDFHVGKDNYAQRKIFKEILNHVRDKREQNWIPDLVFITGDIADRGQANEYKTFADEFLGELYTILGDSWQGSVLAVPGNHDVDQNEVEFLAREEICQADHRVFDSTASGLKKRQKFLLNGVNAYLTEDASDAPKRWLDSPAGTFSQKLEIRSTTLGIVGINTAWLSKDNKDRGKLTPGVDLVKEALEQVQDCDVRIVLGHHPLDWLLEKDADRIRQTFGKYGVLYLHGHLHQARAKGEENSAGRRFLSIQAGAAFQARDDEVWKNGLVWGELGLEEQQLRLQPRHWSPNHEGWVLSSESFHPERQLENGHWWGFSLPGSEQSAAKPLTVANKQTAQSVKPSEGWNLEDQKTVIKRRAGLKEKELSEQEALQYFDGGTPDWRIALSPVIPQREIVGKLCATLKNSQGQSKPTVVLLLGAGGEGKSTAVLQTVVALVANDPSWQVLWRHDSEAVRLPAEILALPQEGQKWLIASDDADGIADEVFKAVRALHKEERGNVQFLLTCRDTDWIAWEKKATTPRNWSAFANFQRQDISGLSPQDATVMVQAWQQYGDEGLGQLSGKPEAEAVQLLVKSAEEESATGEGAFFGAMLKMRLGDRLKDHLRVLLSRFAEREIPGGGNLLQAFAYIAAMHAEGLMFLSKPVLAEVLGCEKRTLKSKVLFPLGKEAPATQAGEFIFTRHKTIAQAAVEILSEQFAEDVDELYVDLSKAAITAGDKGIHIPEYPTWKHELIRHFAKAGNTNLAIEIARGMVERIPNDVHLLVSVAKFYREIDQRERAAQLFREKAILIRNNRVFFAEWGTVEALLNNRPLAVWIEAVSLADHISKEIDNQQARIGLTTLGLNLTELYTAFNNRVFVEGQGAVARLGLSITTPDSDRKGYSHFQAYLRNSHSEGIPDMDWQTAFQKLLIAIQTAYELCGEKALLGDRLRAPSEMTFNGLRYLVENAIKRDEQRR